MISSRKWRQINSKRRWISYEVQCHFDPILVERTSTATDVHLQSGIKLLAFQMSSVKIMRKKILFSISFDIFLTRHTWWAFPFQLYKILTYYKTYIIKRHTKWSVQYTNLKRIWKKITMVLKITTLLMVY